MSKFLTQPQMPANQAFTNRKTTFQIVFQIEKEKTKSERQKTKSKKGVRFGFLSISKSSTLKTKSKKNNPLDGADLETEKLSREKARKLN